MILHGLLTNIEVSLYHIKTITWRRNRNPFIKLSPQAVYFQRLSVELKKLVISGQEPKV